MGQILVGTSSWTDKTLFADTVRKLMFRHIMSAAEQLVASLERRGMWRASDVETADISSVPPDAATPRYKAPDAHTARRQHYSRIGDRGRKKQGGSSKLVKGKRR